jgi:hypothetical protein
MKDTNGLGEMVNISVFDQVPPRLEHGTFDRTILVYNNYFKLTFPGFRRHPRAAMALVTEVIVWSP